jgi:hypothetical protein
MKHNISIAVAALAVTFAGCNARSDNANKVTVAGCVQSAEQGLGSTDKKDIDKFMLTNVASSAAAPSTAPSTSSSTSANDPARSDPGSDRARSDQATGDRAGSDQANRDQARSDAAAPAASAPAASGTAYMLDGKTSELRQHLNQRVEVTGRLDVDDANKSSSQTIDRRPELHVDSVRMISPNCQ